MFEPYAVDLCARLMVPADASVLELACGTGIVTRIEPGVTIEHTEDWTLAKGTVGESEAEIEAALQKL